MDFLLRFGYMEQNDFVHSTKNLVSLKQIFLLKQLFFSGYIIDWYYYDITLNNLNGLS